ncbi:MAG: hypothetical protein ABSF63_11160 [Candidatus Bathyarchaeia archaeon]|jgi:hypothetical protein
MATLYVSESSLELAAWKSVLRKVLGPKGLAAVERAVRDELTVRD